MPNVIFSKVLVHFHWLFESFSIADSGNRKCYLVTMKTTISEGQKTLKSQKMPPPPNSFLSKGRRPFGIAARAHSRRPAGLRGVIHPREGRGASFWSRASPSAHLSPARGRRAAATCRKYFFRCSRFCTLELPFPRRSRRRSPLRNPAVPPPSFLSKGRRPFGIAARAHSRRPAGLPGVIHPREGRGASFWSRACQQSNRLPSAVR